jgi:molybdenum cofactor biosynthesis protein B
MEKFIKIGFLFREKVMSTPAKHKKGAKKHYKCAILTISTSKYWKKEKGEENIGDTSGEIAKELLTKNGHEVVYYDVLPDEENKIHEGVSKALNTDADFIVTSGGTGLTKSDVTIEVISKLMIKEMQGFGELFRLKSYDEIGTAAVLSRAIAGVINQKAIFCLPGSPDAVRLALTEIILPEIAHIMKHVRD